MIVPVILCGGSGTRLWPLSRQQHPKQFLPLVNEQTLLQNTIKRLDGLEFIAPPIVLCNENHRFIVAEQLNRINCPPSDIILEPIGRNTAPAVTIAALTAQDKWKNPTLLVLPADHHIRDVKSFHSALIGAVHLSEEGHLVTFGIIPTSPETGYGYIRKGAAMNTVSGQTENEAFRIAGFVEKPDIETARQYLDSGDYCWNSGMFMFTAKQILAEMDTFSPEIATACRRAYAKGRRDLDFFRLDTESFAACPSDSIDYAVMEYTRNGAMTPLAAGWNDLGSWHSLWHEADKDIDGNLISGDIVIHDVKDSYLRASHRLLAAVGLNRHVVVETADAVFVAPRDRAQEVKNLVEQLKSNHRPETRTHRRTYHLWGSSEAVTEGEQFQVKRIALKAGAHVSYQKHRHRAEHWVVVRGQGRVIKGKETITLGENESIFIPPDVYHQLENPGPNLLEVIEIRTGPYLREDDVIRPSDSPRG